MNKQYELCHKTLDILIGNLSCQLSVLLYNDFDEHLWNPLWNQFAFDMWEHIWDELNE